MRRARVKMYRNVYEGHPEWCLDHPRPTLVTVMRRRRNLKLEEGARCVYCNWQVEGDRLEACRAFERMSRMVMLHSTAERWVKFNVARSK